MSAFDRRLSDVYGDHAIIPAGRGEVVDVVDVELDELAVVDCSVEFDELSSELVSPESGVIDDRVEVSSARIIRRGSSIVT